MGRDPGTLVCLLDSPSDLTHCPGGHCHLLNSFKQVTNTQLHLLYKTTESSRENTLKKKKLNVNTTVVAVSIVSLSISCCNIS